MGFVALTETPTNIEIRYAIVFEQPQVKLTKLSSGLYMTCLKVLQLRSMYLMNALFANGISNTY